MVKLQRSAAKPDVFSDHLSRSKYKQKVKKSMQRMLHRANANGDGSGMGGGGDGGGGGGRQGKEYLFSVPQHQSIFAQRHHDNRNMTKQVCTVSDRDSQHVLH